MSGNRFASLAEKSALGSTTPRTSDRNSNLRQPRPLRRAADIALPQRRMLETIFEREQRSKSKDAVGTPS